MDIHELNLQGYHRVIEAIDTDFHAIVCIHNINLGPALGGCRVTQYKDRDEHLRDALRLGTGMTYKNALAGLNMGGGKAAINAPKATNEVLEKFAKVMDYINQDSVEYITAGDVGTGPNEVAYLGTLTEFVNGQQLGQDSGYATAYGVYMSMIGALKFHNRELRKQQIFIEGLGKVGMRLTKFLKNDAKTVYTFDPEPSVSRTAMTVHNAVLLPTRDAGFRYSTVYSPCALGGSLNIETLDLLSPGDIVCGGANNIFSTDIADVQFAGKGITVVPDFLANAGGVIIVSNGYQDAEWDDPAILEKLRQLQFTTHDVLYRARDEKHTPMFIAKKMAEEIFNS